MNLNRRTFIANVGLLAAGTVSIPSFGGDFVNRKLRVALVGTGIRGITFWGKRLVDQYSDILEFVGLSDHNPGRLEFGRSHIGVDCPTFVDFEEMMTTVKPDLLIVTTKDSTHHEFIIKGLKMGSDVLTEKPLTTDEDKCEAILEAERNSSRKLIVGFNYRWSPYATKIKELLMNKAIGDVTSVEFSWYLNTHHGASYFRRWHGQRESGGTLWIHKATHHFDLLNWWLDSDPEEVFAYGDLEHYGSNGPFRGENCRNCAHTASCDYHWDITKSEMMMNLYVKNEQYDGYIRDNCLFRNEINIYDKMSAQVKYANNVTLSYNLTTYSPFEGWKVAFNGTEGRIEAWLDIPHLKIEPGLTQEELHALEMSQDGDDPISHEPIILHKLWSEHEKMTVSMTRKGHGGGDAKLHDKIFMSPETDDPYHRAAGVRDGAMSILIGVAARKSIESGRPIRIAELTSLEPRAVRLRD